MTIITEKSPINQAKSQRKLKRLSKSLPYRDKSLPVKDRLAYYIEYCLPITARFTYSAQTYCDILGTKDRSYMAQCLRELRDDPRFIISLPQRRNKSQFFFTLEVQFSPLYKQLLEDQPPGINILERSESMLILQPSVNRENLCLEITRKMSLTVLQQAKLEAYPTWVLYNSWMSMRRYLSAGKQFFYSAFTYFNSILDTVSGVKRFTIKKIHEHSVSFSLYYQKVRELAKELLIQKDYAIKAQRLACDAQVMIEPESLYWIDNEYDYGQ